MIKGSALRWVAQAAERVPVVGGLARRGRRWYQRRSETRARALRQTTERARAAMAGGDWRQAVTRWEEAIAAARTRASATMFACLAVAYRELGDTPAAVATIERGRARLGNHPELALESAQLAMVEQDWDEAVRRYEEFLRRDGQQATDKLYAYLAIAYREQGNLPLAAAVLERGRSRFPDSMRVAVEWAQFAMVDEDWPEAVRRYRAVLQHDEPGAPDKVYARLAIAYREQDELEVAADVLERGRERFPDSGLIAVEWAQLAMVEQDWDEAVRRYTHVLEHYPDAAVPKAYQRLAIAYRELGDVASAARTIVAGRTRFPADVSLTAEWAELAMVEQDWPAALARWQQVLDARRAAGRAAADAPFVRRGSASDWYETAWQQLARSWDRIHAGNRARPAPPLYQVLARTLHRAELYDEARLVLEDGVRAHPADRGLAFHLAALTLEAGTGGDRDTQLHELATILQETPPVAAVCEALKALDARGEGAPITPPRGERHPEAPSLADALRRNEATLERFRTPPVPELGGLGPVHVLRFTKGSSVELQLKRGRYLSRRAVEQRVADISERDGWPERTATENLLLQRARRISEEYGKRFEDLPYLPAETLADAVLFVVHHELCLYEPMRRLAEDIAGERDSAPVFIESPTSTFRYLDGYTFSRFDVIYLYYELRRRGVNAFLCLADSPNGRDRPGAVAADDAAAAALPPQPPRLHLRPGARAMRPRGVVRAPSRGHHARALIPSGVRSVGRVLDRLGPALIYASGSAIKEFAYDRSLRQGFPFEPEATIHPPGVQMPSISLDLWPAAPLHGVQLAGGAGAGGRGAAPGDRTSPEVEAMGSVEISAAVGGDWLSWLHRVLQGYLLELSVRAHADVVARGIEEAHVCDHLFPEPALFANAVRSRGGRVVLWPHSANPVHVDMRKPGTFDTVYAVTRAGCDRWHKQFPGVEVVRAPTLMLDRPKRDARVGDGLPLSVVVIAGRSALRYMPVLDRTRHARSYREFFAGLERLQQDHDVGVYFKPRGLTGEHEMWLSRTVGSSAGWTRVLQHPTRLDLPNMLFVSVSMGSSALLEGLSRGVPGLIVRDFAVRDYTAIEEGVFPVGTTAEALELVASCLRPEGLEALLERELAVYRQEFEGHGEAQG